MSEILLERRFGELLEEAPIRLEMDMSEILLESWRWGEGRGGSYFLEGVREKGGSDEPPEPPLVTGLYRNDNGE